MICERCGKEYKIELGFSKRFCTITCAQSRKGNLKCGDGFRGKKHSLRKKEQIAETTRKTRGLPLKNPDTIFDVSSRTIMKILKRMKLGCSNCGWYIEDVSCDLHHIVEQKFSVNNSHDNITYICPNCHRLVHSGKIKKESLIPLSEYIGDSWKKYYFG